MLISKALRLGYSNSVSQLFKERVTNDVGGSLGKPLDIETFVFLYKLEMNPVARGETIQRLAAVPSCLVLEIHGLEKHELLFSF